MTIYECFDFQEEDNRKIASSINDAINEIVCCGDKGLHSLYNAISYGSYALVCFILERLEQKKLITSQLLQQLKKNLEEADEMYTEDVKKRTRQIEKMLEDDLYLTELLEKSKEKCNVLCCKKVLTFIIYAL